MPLVETPHGLEDMYGNPVGTVTEVTILKAPKGTKVIVEGLDESVKVVDLTRGKFTKIMDRVRKSTIRKKSLGTFIDALKDKGGTSVDAVIESKGSVLSRVVFTSESASGRKIIFPEIFKDETPADQVNNRLSAIREELPAIKTSWHVKPK